MNPVAWGALQGGGLGALLIAAFAMVVGTNPVAMVLRDGWARLVLVSFACMGAGAALLTGATP